MRVLILFLIVAFQFALACEKYNRAKLFGGWRDADKDGQNTRVEVLVEESLTPVNFSDTKHTKIISGKWHCPYSNQDFTKPKDVDIDHMVPLKEAYESGAWKWTQDRRIGYANYLAKKNHLIAVKFSENRSKSDQDPADWLPSYVPYRKQYVKDWCDIKSVWGLSADQKEVDAIKSVLGQKSAKIWLKNIPISAETNCED